MVEKWVDWLALVIECIVLTLCTGRKRKFQAAAVLSTAAEGGVTFLVSTIQLPN